MTTGDKVLALIATSFVLACFAVAIASVPGPWLTIGGTTGAFMGTFLGMRANRRQERQRQEAFAERVHLIRDGKLKPGEPFP